MEVVFYIIIGVIFAMIIILHEDYYAYTLENPCVFSWLWKLLKIKRKKD